MPIFKHILYSLFIVLMLPLAAAADDGGIEGKLVAPSGQPVSYATITLLNADSSVVNGDLSDDNGAFSIKSAKNGSFILRIESLGYESQFRNVVLSGGKSGKLGVIKLRQSSTTLNTVSITAEKRLMELKVDKKVFNVEKNTTVTGGSAADVLDNVPSVSTDVDGNVSLRGKGNVNVLIDGKPATLLGSDVASALQSLPAGSIESVEVITNPSAKYDAQGTTGIINIITKKESRRGFNGNVRLGAGTRDKYNGNLGMNLRSGKWNVFMNSSFRIKNTFHNVTTHREDLAPTNGYNQSYYTYEHVPRLFNGSFNTVGASYDFDDNNSITMTQNINVMQWGYKDYSEYYVFSEPHQTGDTVLYRDRYSDMLGGPRSYSSALDYKRKFRKKGEELSVDATFASRGMTKSQNYETRVYVPGTTILPGIISNAPGSGGSKSLNVWADYTNPLFTEKGKLGFGVKSQYYNFYSSNTPTLREDVEGSTPSVDSTLYATYDYTTQIHAAYVNWNDQLGKLSYQVGLRGESAIYDGYGEVPRYAKFHNSFQNLFPSAFLSYQLNEEQSFYLNYSRRTNRPRFHEMMPYKDYSNPGMITSGNPNLIPEFIHNVEFSYNLNDDKGNNIIVSTYFSQTRNLIERIQRPILLSDEAEFGITEGTGTSLLRIPLNIASGTTYGLEGTGHLQFTEDWDATLSMNVFNNQLKIGNVEAAYASYLTNNSGYSWFAKANSNLKLPADFSLQFTGNYVSPKVITQGRVRESYWIDLALKKNFLDGKASVVVNCSDVFKTRQFISDYTTANYTQTINRVKETRIGNITFSYRFGNNENSKGGYGRGRRSKSKRPEPSDENRTDNLKDGGDDGQNG